MRWRGQKQSSNVEDRRGNRGPSVGGIGGRGGMLNLLPMIFKLFGLKGGVVAILALGAYGIFTGNLGGMLGGDSIQSADPQPSGPVKQSAAEEELVSFVSVVLADTETTWHELFKQMGDSYKEPKLILFRGAVRSACGLGQAATGPFYCPSDQKVYIDLSFYNDLKNRFKAPGDFAQAYVIAHEVGHHVQTLLGISNKVHQAKRSLSQTEANKLSVRQELQADCFAGIWAHHADRSRQLLEQGDAEEALTAASAIGDDRLQKQSQGHVTPDSFTHGRSTQRVAWFNKGFRSGTLKECDTFSAATL
ncbi:neutral zinc metallopeptidase [Sedimenticola selenatireducens]|uniref:KPN_02809 family neutral zinc metallopeptidase n=1 Tax=Sedimenticola selenatireducens TaxID=191960 RepID=UPI00048B4FDD|nr:neutral zinc metallopeptidase [Sedimenticola selenatireducens]